MHTGLKTALLGDLGCGSSSVQGAMRNRKYLQNTRRSYSTW